MAQISKYRLPEKTESEILSLFAEVLAMLSIKADIFALSEIKVFRPGVSSGSGQNFTVSENKQASPVV